MKHLKLIAVTIALASTAQAHTGATGVTLERMQGMSALADAMKAIAPMVRDQVAFDPARVRETAAVLQANAGREMVDLFVDGTGAAPSEAAPAVWDQPARFAELADVLADQGATLDVIADDKTVVQRVFREIGQTCSACHEVYRIKRD